MQESISREIETIGRDTVSGASALLQRGLDILARAAAAEPEAARAVALALCRAQPSMAGFRTAAAVVLGAAEPAPAVERFAQRVARAPASIARHAADLLAMRRSTGAIRIVTCSRSDTVAAAIVRVAAAGDVSVACAEGRPACEGRRLAVALASGGITVEVYSDAAVGVAIPGADALLVGADAVGDSAFINKVGTRALAALAASAGIPTYVLAGSEKVVPPEVFRELPLHSGGPDEIWPDLPPGLLVRNPYFELIPLSLVAALVTEAGVRNI